MAKKYTLTENGALTLADSGNPLVNLFFTIGSARNTAEVVRANFKTAMRKNTQKAVAILLCARDIRHDGMGERQIFRTLLKDLILDDGIFVDRVIRLIPEIGRFDDLVTAYGTLYESIAVEVWADAIRERNVLAAKWAKREDKKLQKALGLNEANLRKLLSSIRKDHIVEAKMCNKDFGAIDYAHVPSVAGTRYAKAFHKNDGERYRAFIDNPNTVVHASVAFPYDVYRMWRSGKCEAGEINKYWNNLKDLELTGSVLPIIDTSSSMTWFKVAGQLEPIDIATSIGVYCSQKIEGKFKNMAMTFNTNPEIYNLPVGDVCKAFETVRCSNWGGSTDIQKTYRLLLQKAKLINATQEDMPKYLMIISDMQFNHNMIGNLTALEAMRNEFKCAGYKMPRIIFWNMDARDQQFPSANFENDVALISGFSPSILKAVLKGENCKITPEMVMEEAIQPFMDMLK